MFIPYPDDPVKAGMRRIHEVVNFPTTWAAIDIPRADPEQQQEWLRWTQCLVTNIPTQQFSDLFPQAAIFQYRDDQGKPLPGLRAHPYDSTSTWKWRQFMHEARQQGWFVTGDPMVYWSYLPPDATSLGLCDQENYLRVRALPTAINVLMQAFQNECRVLMQAQQKENG